MTKENNKPADIKPTNGGASKNLEKENKKSNTPPTSSSGNASTNDKEYEPNLSEASGTKKKSYVRGESQKPVTKAYRNNWNSIFKKG